MLISTNNNNYFVIILIWSRIFSILLQYKWLFHALLLKQLQVKVIKCTILTWWFSKMLNSRDLYFCGNFEVMWWCVKFLSRIIIYHFSLVFTPVNVWLEWRLLKNIFFIILPLAKNIDCCFTSTKLWSFFASCVTWAFQYFGYLPIISNDLDGFIFRTH